MDRLLFVPSFKRPYLGAPQKGVNKANNDFSSIFSEKHRVLKRMFLASSEGPGGFRELRGPGLRSNVCKTWPLRLMEEFS